MYKVLKRYQGTLEVGIIFENPRYTLHLHLNEESNCDNRRTFERTFRRRAISTKSTPTPPMFKLIPLIGRGNYIRSVEKSRKYRFRGNRAPDTFQTSFGCDRKYISRGG